MTLYNDIVRRPHLPREHPIRNIMSATGIDLLLYGRSASMEDVEGEAEVAEEEAGAEECEEEEHEEDDPCT